MNEFSPQERYDFPIGRLMFFIGALFVILNLDTSFAPVTNKSDPWGGLMVSGASVTAVFLLYAHWFSRWSVFVFGCGISLAFIPRLNWLLQMRSSWMCHWFASTDFIWLVWMIGFAILLGAYANSLRFLLMNVLLVVKTLGGFWKQKNVLDKSH